MGSGTGAVLALTDQGLFCPPGGFHIDPVVPVPRAVITHGHADHARSGHGAVLATADTLDIMAARYGEGFTGSRQAAAYGAPIRVGDVTLALYPAGHVLGSAQVAIEHGGRRAVITGDYKRQGDPTAAPFELVPCDLFVTEATFALPVFRHPEAIGEVEKLVGSLSLFTDRPHLLGAYALGKAQRMIALLRQAGFDRPVYLHGALQRLTDLYQDKGIDLGPLVPVKGIDPKSLAGELVMCPPGSLSDRWAQRFGDAVSAFASGWMRVRARARQRGVELPLVVSDHADWEDLCTTIVETGASEVWVTHGQEEALCHWCALNGIEARPLRLLGYGDEDPEAVGADVPPVPDVGAGDPS